MDSVRKFLKINVIILPVLSFLLIFIYVKTKTVFSLAFLVVFAIWLIIDGLLSLRNLDIIADTKSIEESNLSAEEKEKRKKWLINLVKCFSICKIIGPIVFFWFWYILLGTK